jgi:hypothetical protein
MLSSVSSHPVSAARDQDGVTYACSSTRVRPSFLHGQDRPWAAMEVYWQFVVQMDGMSLAILSTPHDWFMARHDGLASVQWGRQLSSHLVQGVFLSPVSDWELTGERLGYWLSLIRRR